MTLEQSPQALILLPVGPGEINLAADFSFQAQITFRVPVPSVANPTFADTAKMPKGRAASLVSSQCLPSQFSME